MTEVGIKRLHPQSVMPRKAHYSDAAFDLFAACLTTIDPGDTETVPTGIALELPAGIAALVMSRSGLAARDKVFVLNSPGLIDPGYRGEVKVILHNGGEERQTFREGSRIAQMMFTPVLSISLTEREFRSDSDRGENGIGSSGVHCDHLFLHIMDHDTFVCPRCDVVFSREQFTAWHDK